MKNSKLRNVTAVLAKVLEVASWVGTVMLLLSSIVLTINNNVVKEAYDSGVLNAKSITINGASANTTEWFIEAITKGDAFFLFSPQAVVLIFTALIFRNIYKVFSKSNVSEPFSMENVKRIRMIGYYAIAIPVSKIVMSLIMMAIVKYGDNNMSVSLSEVVFGLVALCLSQYFAYGAQLERDVDGLL